MELSKTATTSALYLVFKDEFTIQFGIRLYKKRVLHKLEEPFFKYKVTN
jgi:hypothetical protein